MKKDFEKKSALEAFVAQFKTELASLNVAAKSAKEASIHSESKQENKHDTRATEASYLAAGQALRIADFERLVHEFENYLAGCKPQTAVEPGALIKCESEGRVNYSFYAIRGGGQKVELDGKNITVVTRQSLLGEALINATVGEEIEFENKKGITLYKVLAIW